MKTSSIAKKEISSFFDTLSGYLILSLFLLITGLFTWITGGNVFYQGQADLSVFYQVALWTLFFFAPAITMKALSEELSSGTLDLLYVRPVNSWQIVFGKFMAYMFLVFLGLLFTLPYVLTVSFLGELDYGQVFAGYLGLWLSGAVFVAIGIFASSLTKNQIVAFLIALAFSSIFQFVVDLLVPLFGIGMGTFFSAFSLPWHFWSISRGVIQLSDIVYFVSLILFWLYAAKQVLNQRFSR